MPSTGSPGWQRWVRRRRWLLALVAAALAVQASALWRVLPGRRPPPLGDSIIFEYYGWRLLAGDQLYVDLWEVKPPLSFQTTAGLALLSGGDPLLYHALVVAATNLAVVAGVALVGLLVREVTGDSRAALVGGLAAFAHPVVFMRAAYGFKAKYFVVLAGLLAVYLLLRDRPLLGGVAAAAATGYWQLGIVFPLVVLGLGAQRGGARGLARVVAGGAAGATATLAPVVLRGNLVPMVAQTVLAPLVVGGRWGAERRLHWLGNLLGVGGAAALVVGLAGAVAVLAADERRCHWWLPAVWAWFLAHLTLVNVDYYGDLIVLVMVNGLAVGALVGHLLGDPAATPGGRTAPWTGPGTTQGGGGPGWSGPPAVLAGWLGGARRRAHAVVDPPPLAPAAPVVGLVVALLVVNVAVLGGVLGTEPHPVKEPGNVSDPDEVSVPYVLDEKRALLFHDLEPGTCHVFVGNRQRAWIDLTGGDRRADTCDRVPTGYGLLTSLGPATVAPGDDGPDDGGDGIDGGATATDGIPTATPVPLTSTPTAVPPVVADGAPAFRTADDGTLLVAVPVENQDDRTVTASVTATVTAGDERYTATRSVTLSPGESATVHFRFDAEGAAASSVSADIETRD